MSLEFREEVPSGDINLETMRIWMALKTKRVGEAANVSGGILTFM